MTYASKELSAMKTRMLAKLDLQIASTKEPAMIARLVALRVSVQAKTNPGANI